MWADFSKHLVEEKKEQHITEDEYDVEGFTRSMYSCLYSRLLDMTLEGKDLGTAYSYYMENIFANDVIDVAAENLLECHDSGYVGGVDIFWELPDGKKGEVGFDAVEEEYIAILWYRFCKKNGFIEVETVGLD